MAKKLTDAQVAALKFEYDVNCIVVIATGRKNEVIRFQYEQNADDAHGLYTFLDTISKVVSIAPSVSALMRDIRAGLTLEQRATPAAGVGVDPMVLHGAKVLMNRYLAAFSSAA
jgi:hypothetical protein